METCKKPLFASTHITARSYLLSSFRYEPSILTRGEKKDLLVMKDSSILKTDKQKRCEFLSGISQSPTK